MKYNFSSGNEYFRSEANGECSDLGFPTISTVGECRLAIPQIQGAITVNEEETNSSSPKGCYLDSSNRVVWNNHKTGSPNNDARQICVRKGL